jgi:hypothetical protein
MSVRVTRTSASRVLGSNVPLRVEQPLQLDERRPGCAVGEPDSLELEVTVAKANLDPLDGGWSPGQGFQAVHREPADGRGQGGDDHRGQEGKRAQPPEDPPALALHVGRLPRFRACPAEEYTPRSARRPLGREVCDDVLVRPATRHDLELDPNRWFGHEES